MPRGCRTQPAEAAAETQSTGPGTATGLGISRIGRLKEDKSLL